MTLEKWSFAEQTDADKEFENLCLKRKGENIGMSKCQAK